MLGLSAPSLIQAGLCQHFIHRCARTCLWMWNHLIMPAKSSQWGCHAVWGNLFIRSFGFYGALISHRFLIFWSSSLLTQLGLSPNLDFPSHSSKHSFPCWYPHFFLLPFLPTRMPQHSSPQQKQLNSLHCPFLVYFPGALRASSCRTKLGAGGCHHDGHVELGWKQLWLGLEAWQIWGCGGWVICLFVRQLVSPVFWPSLKFLKGDSWIRWISTLFSALIWWFAGIRVILR